MINNQEKARGKKNTEVMEKMGAITRAIINVLHIFKRKK